MPTLFPEGSTSSRFSPPPAAAVESVALVNQAVRDADTGRARYETSAVPAALVDIRNQPVPSRSAPSSHGATTVGQDSSTLSQSHDQIDATHSRAGQQLNRSAVGTSRLSGGIDYGGGRYRGIGIRNIYLNQRPAAQRISNARDRASETVDAALAQCSDLDPTARHAIAGIFGTLDRDVDQYLPALLRKLTAIGSFLRFHLRYTPKSFAVTFMPGGPCATFCPRRDVVKLNADAFFDRSEREQADVLVHVAMHARAGADDYFSLPTGRHDIESRFADDYAESTQLLLSHPGFGGSPTLEARVRIHRDNVVRRLRAPSLARAFHAFKSDTGARLDLLLHNADTLALVVRVLSDIQAAREREGPDATLPPRRAENHAAFYLRQAAGGYRQQCGQQRGPQREPQRRQQHGHPRGHEHAYRHGRQRAFQASFAAARRKSFP